MNDRRLDDLKRFYFILGSLEQNVPGPEVGFGDIATDLLQARLWLVSG